MDKEADGDDPELHELRGLRHRRDNLHRTALVLGTHDVVVQKLITKARDDLVPVLLVLQLSPVA